MNEPRRYVSTPSGFLLVLRQGDEVLVALETLMRAESIPSTPSAASASSRLRASAFSTSR